MDRKFLDLLLEVTDEKELLEMHKMLVGRLKDVRHIADVGSLSKLRAIPIGARVEIRWRGNTTYHGTYTGLGRSKVSANIDELNGRGYRFPPNWIVKVLDEKEKPAVKVLAKGKMTIVAPPGTSPTMMERVAEAHAIFDAAQKIQDEADRIMLGNTGEHIDWDARGKEEEAIWERMKKLDESSKPGLQIGRVCSWPVADGQAHYIVTGVGSRVRLMHIPLWDAYRSDAVDDRGTATRSTVEKCLGFHDSMSELFGKKKAQEG